MIRPLLSWSGALSEQSQPRRAVEAACRLLHDRRLGVREELLLVGHEPGCDIRRIELAVVAADQVGSPGYAHDSAPWPSWRRRTGASRSLAKMKSGRASMHGPIELVLRRSRAVGSQRLLAGG